MVFLYYPAIFVASAVLTIFGASSGFLGGGTGTLNQLDQWKSDGTNITQSVASKPVKITGLSDGCTSTVSGVLTSSGSPCGAGGGSGGGTWSTTTSQVAGTLINYPNNTNDVVVIGSNATTSAEFYYDPTNKHLLIQSASSTIAGSITISDTASVGTLALTNDLTVSNGGTGASTFTSGGVLYGNTTGALQVTSAGATGSMLQGGGTPQFQTNGTLSTSLTTPLLIGGTAAGSSLTLRSTSGNGTTDFIRFTLGNAGAVEAGRFTTQGFLGLGTTTPSHQLTISSGSPQISLTDGTLTANPWTMRSINGAFYLATSSPSTYATSTVPGLTIDLNGVPAFPKLVSCNTIDTDASGNMTCGSDASGVGGSGSVATSTNEVANQVAVFTSNSATPALIGGDSDFTFLTDRLTVTNASTTRLTALTEARFGATATTTISSAGNVLLPAAGTLTIPALTSALLQTDGNGLLAEYAGTSCTNQFVRSLSALGAATCATVIGTDVDLGDLTAGNTSLTLSGTYDGQTARTIVLNVGNANTWTAAQTFTVGAGVPGIISNSLVGIGTSTPKWALQVASSTGPQLTLSDGSLTSTHWSLRNINGNLYFATSSPSTFATSTDTRLFFGVDGNIGIGAVNTSPSKISFGSGTNVNVNPNISPIFQDPTDARFGACTSDDCVVMQSSGGLLSIFGFDYAGGVGRNINMMGFGGNLGISTSTPFAKLAVQGTAGASNPIFQVASSSNTPYFTVHPTGTTTISGASAASSTPYIYSTAASKGGSIILEDTDGAGCTEVSALNGVLTAATVTCPTEI